DNKNKALPTTTKERIITDKARVLVSFVILRLKSSRFSFPWAMLNILRKEIAKVVVLIPPPFDPGEAPTHIKKNMITIEGDFNPSMLTVEKPAERGVTLKKKEVTVFPQTL